MHALRHLLTPGTPGYAALKFGALAGAFGLRWAVVRRSRRGDADHAPSPESSAPRERANPHPRSKKKRRSRRRR